MSSFNKTFQFKEFVTLEKHVNKKTRRYTINMKNT